MKRIMTVVALAAFAAAPAAAQWAGMPVWNSPKGGTGVTINGDVGLPNTDAGKGTAFGARGMLGLANLKIRIGFAALSGPPTFEIAIKSAGTKFPYPICF